MDKILKRLLRRAPQSPQGDAGGKPRLKCLAFTLVELLVVIAIIFILIALLMPALTRAKESAKSALCLAKIHQLTIAVIMYASDNKGSIPPAYDQVTGKRCWYSLWASGFVKNESGILSCPSDRTTTAMEDYYPYAETGGKNRSYVYATDAGYRYSDGTFLAPFHTITTLAKPTQDIIIWCSDWPFENDEYYGWHWTYTVQVPSLFPPLHGRAYNAGFMDGHAESMTTEKYNRDYFGKMDW